MAIENESQIVESAQCGDVNSFGKLYEHYYRTMVWLAYSILNDYDLAEDSAQETFVYACDELAGLRRPDKFGSWLAAICRNVACRKVRQMNREVTLNDPHVSIEKSSNHGSERAIKEAISSLQQMYREIIVLYYYDGMSYEQIESLLGISRSKVKGRLFAARQKIGRYLQRKGLNGDNEL